MILFEELCYRGDIDPWPRNGEVGCIYYSAELEVSHRFIVLLKLRRSLRPLLFSVRLSKPSKFYPHLTR